MSKAGTNINPIVELTNFQEWQLSRYGNVLDMPEINPDGELESGKEDLDRLAEWIHQQSERQMHEREQEFFYSSF